MSLFNCLNCLNLYFQRQIETHLNVQIWGEISQSLEVKRSMKSSGKTKEMEVHGQLLFLDFFSLSLSPSRSFSGNVARIQTSTKHLSSFLYPSNAIYWRTSGRDRGWRLEWGEQRTTAESLESVQGSWQAALRHRFLMLHWGQCPPGQVGVAERACQIGNVSFMDMRKGSRFAETESLRRLKEKCRWGFFTVKTLPKEVSLHVHVQRIDYDFTDCKIPPVNSCLQNRTIDVWQLSLIQKSPRCRLEGKKQEKGGRGGGRKEKHR